MPSRSLQEQERELRSRGVRIPTRAEIEREMRAQSLDPTEMDWEAVLKCVFDNLFEKPLPQALRDCITGKK